MFWLVTEGDGNVAEALAAGSAHYDSESAMRRAKAEFGRVFKVIEVADYSCCRPGGCKEYRTLVRTTDAMEVATE